MRPTNRAFGAKSQYESTQSVSEYVTAAKAFSFLKFYQHSVLCFFAKLSQLTATTWQSTKKLNKIIFCRQVTEYDCNFAS